MGKRKRQSWKAGDLFAVPLSDGRHVLGQILNDADEFAGDRPCVYFDKIVDPHAPYSSAALSESDIILATSTAIFYVENGRWPVVGHQEVWLPPDKWPNAKYRFPGSSWIGAKFHDAGIIEDFLEAYYGLCPWDRYFDPEYFDKLLYDPSKKPKNLIYSKTRPRGPIVAWRLNPGGDEFRWMKPVNDAGIAELARLGQGQRVSRWVPLRVREFDPRLPGKLPRRSISDTDFARLAPGVPAFSAKAWKQLTPLISGCAQAMPLQCEEEEGEFVAVNVLSVLPEGLKPGALRPPMFKLAPGADEPVYVTDMFKEAVEHAAAEHNAIVGIGFTPITTS